MMTRKQQIGLELEAWQLRLTAMRNGIAEYTVTNGRLSVSDAHLIAWLQDSLADIQYIRQCMDGLSEELRTIIADAKAAEAEAAKRERDERDRNPIAG